jgi:hypothetical protein
VTWQDESGAREGVYIPRRDPGSLVNHLAGGRLFPGEHQRATFRVTDADNRIALHMRSADGRVEVDVVGQESPELTRTSVFQSVKEASAFFETGSLGYSATASGRKLDGIELKTDSWKVAPLAIERAHSSYFTDPQLFPRDSIVFDCALVMRDIPHEWASANEMYV